jgi:hypothetical protein
MKIADLRIAGGRCTGRVLGAGAEAPVLRLAAGDVTMPAPEVSSDGDGWRFHATLPVALLSEGARAVLILDAASGAQIGQFSLSVGEELAEDLRAEVAQLRAELDLLKTAFRREMRGRG